MGNFLACKENAECQTQVQTVSTLIKINPIRNLESFLKFQKYTAAGIILLVLGFFVYLLIFYYKAG